MAMAIKLEEIPVEELNRLLGHFFINIKKQNGEEYEPNSRLTSLQSSGIADRRHLREAGRMYSILFDREFETSRKALEAKRKELRREEIIDIVQWPSIGLWNCCNVKRCGGSGYGTSCLIELSCLSIMIVLSLVLILSGDIELNPGPKTGDHSSSCDLLIFHSPELSLAITDVIYNVAEALHAKGLITYDIKNQILTTQANGTYKKAIYLVNVLENYLRVSSDPDKYLIDVCHVLIHQHHQPLTDIGNTILQQLGQPTIDDLPATGTSQPTNNTLPSDVQKYCDIMRNKYIHYDQPNYVSDWPPKLECGQQYFGRLILADLYRNKKQYRQWFMLRGHTDNIPSILKPILFRFPPIQMEDVIKPNESDLSLRVVVDGPPGIGKTTLCRILLNMWATKEQIKHQYDLVLYCPLRNDKVAQAIELKDLFSYECREISIVTEWMEREHGKGVLIIFDGWDELTAQLKRSSLPTSIIQRKLLNNCSVLVTSRTYATSSLLNLTSYHKHVQVMGFSSDEVKTVIRGTLEEPHLADKLIDDLEVRGDVLSLCYIPLVCSMVIYVYVKLNGQLPTTLTQLYENFILQTIRRHIGKNVHSYQPEDIRGLNERDLPSDVHVGRDFKELCQFAYLSLKGNNPKMMFSSLELQQHMKQSGYYGLITEYGEDGNQFLHLSIQEFLASWWIAKYEEKTHEIFNEHFDNDHFKMCLRFTAGLTHLEPNHNYEQYFNNEELGLVQCIREPWFGFDNFYHSRLYKNHEINIGNHIITDDSNELAIFLLQLLYESQNSQLCSTLRQSMKNHSLCLCNLKLSLFDTLCVSYFFNNSNISWNHLDFGELNEQQVQLLNNALTINSQHNKCKILEVKLEHPTMETLKLFQLPLVQYIQECYVVLNLSHCNLFLYLVELLKLHHQLEIVHFSSLLDKDVTPLSVEESDQLTELLNNNSTLQELVIDIGGDREYCDEVTSLCNGVAMNKSITSFTLQLPYVGSLSAKTMQQLLMNNHTIQALDLKTNDLPSVNVVRTPLTTLRLDGRYTLDQLTLFLPHIEGLQYLLLPHHSYPPNLIFQSHPSLQQLEILLDTVERATELFTILQSNNVTLKALRVDIEIDDIFNRIGPSICDMLRRNQKIKFLEIDMWSICTSFLSCLTTGLLHNTSLQELSVHIPLSPTNNKQITSFFNVISKMNNLTELKVNFRLDQLFSSNFSSWEERRLIMTQLYYEHGLPSLTNMIMSHSSIRLIHVTLYDVIKYDLSRPNWVELVEQLYQSIFIHPSLKYIRIQMSLLLKNILQKQKKTLTDKLIVRHAGLVEEAEMLLNAQTAGRTSLMGVTTNNLVTSAFRNSKGFLVIIINLKSLFVPLLYSINTKYMHQ